MRFLDWPEVVEVFKGKHVAIVGSAPSCLEHSPGFIDSHDVVVRVNNYKTGEKQGYRTDVHYAFYGTSVRKSAEDLKRDGVKLCMCKCPDSKPIASDWHEQHGKHFGIDFRYIYQNRKDWWFCDTFIPDDSRFIDKFNLLERHIPTTGFAAILDIVECDPASVYLTGFDFFSSGLHNVDEAWKPGDTTDPIRHMPELESAWVRNNSNRLILDAKLSILTKG